MADTERSAGEVALILCAGVGFGLASATVLYLQHQRRAASLPPRLTPVPYHAPPEKYEEDAGSRTRDAQEHAERYLNEARLAVAQRGEPVHPITNFWVWYGLANSTVAHERMPPELRKELQLKQQALHAAGQTATRDVIIYTQRR
jgi:hypothetical protein